MCKDFWNREPVAVLHKCISGFSKLCPDPVGDGQHQPIHSRGLLPCGEEYGVVAGGYLLFTDYRVLLFALFASIT